VKALTNLRGDIIAVECECGHVFWPVKWNGYTCSCGRKVPREILEKIKEVNKRSPWLK